MASSRKIFIVIAASVGAASAGILCKTLPWIFELLSVSAIYLSAGILVGSDKERLKKNLLYSSIIALPWFLASTLPSLQGTGTSAEMVVGIAGVIGPFLGVMLKLAHYRKAILLAISAFILSVLAGALGWPTQFGVVGLIYFISGLLVGAPEQTTRQNIVLSVITLIPWLILYVPLSLIGSPQTYPISLIGAVGTALGLFARIKLHEQPRWQWIGAMALYAIVIVGGGYVFMQNYLLTYNNRDYLTNYPLASIELTTETGTTIRSEDFRGKVVLLDIWTTSCSICIEKFPDLERLHRQYAVDSTVAIYSLNIRLEGDEPGEAQAIVKPYTFPTLYSQQPVEEVAQLLGFQGVPTVLVVDREGIVRYKGVFLEQSYLIVNNLRAQLQRLSREAEA